MSDRVPDRMSENMPDRMPEYVSHSMPDRMSEEMSDRMPDSVPRFCRCGIAELEAAHHRGWPGAQAAHVGQDRWQ